ncbi:MAG: hypothetical protein IJZ34_02950 [Lachnospiraceae bacterium]|nr:hypothetical protein [Lachnospiraceae bacterium]
MAIWKRIKKYDKDVTEEAEERFSELEKHDMTSMIVSAMLTIWLPCVLVLILICGLAYLFLGLPFAK